MSDNVFEEAFVERIELHLHLDLLADAPQGHPHIINLKSIGDENLREDLSAVDVITSCLYKWNPKALSNLLDLKKTDFYWCHENGHGYVFYVSRSGKEVCVGSRELGERGTYRVFGCPDFEVQYRIDRNGCWNMTGGQGYQPSARQHHFSVKTSDGHQACVENDTMCARELIFKKMWKKNNKKESFRYEVDGEDIVDPEDWE